MLLGASLLRNLLSGKGVKRSKTLVTRAKIPAGGVIRAGEEK